MMLNGWQEQESAAPSTAARGIVRSTPSDNHRDNARRFHDAALPHLDDVYTLARYLLRDSADAQDAVQECYLRALRHFHTYRGPAMKPWLCAILRNVCRGEFARRSNTLLQTEGETEDDSAAAPVWQEALPSPEAEMIREWDGQTIRRLIADLPSQFRETIVLREINDLSYREIAEVLGVPIGTVMSRLAEASVRRAADWLRVKNIGALVVTSGKAVLGIISEREIVHAVSRYGETVVSMPALSVSSLGYNGSAASWSAGSITPRILSVLFSSPASSSSSGNFEIGSSNGRG